MFQDKSSGVWVVDNKAFFGDVLEQIAQGKAVRIPAKGRSMLPLIREDRDLISIRPLGLTSIAIGRILLFRLSDGRYIIHRVEIVSGDQIIMRGDGNIYQRECCSRSDILAEVYAIHRGHRVVRLDDIWWRGFRYLWPSSSFLRRVLLWIYRRL